VLISAARIKRFLSIVLSVALISASLWTIGPIAAADALGHAAASADLQDPLVSDDGTDGPARGARCNHACHAVGHLAALAYAPARLDPPACSGLTFQSPDASSLSSRPFAGLFRPPRSAFQA
jgi:hypothetical protein